MIYRTSSTLTTYRRHGVGVVVVSTVSKYYYKSSSTHGIYVQRPAKAIGKKKYAEHTNDSHFSGTPLEVNALDPLGAIRIPRCRLGASLGYLKRPRVHGLPQRLQPADSWHCARVLGGAVTSYSA